MKILIFYILLVRSGKLGYIAYTSTEQDTSGWTKKIIKFGSNLFLNRNPV